MRQTFLWRTTRPRRDRRSETAKRGASKTSTLYLYNVARLNEPPLRRVQAKRLRSVPVASSWNNNLCNLRERNMDTEKFIQCVRNYPVLYDTRHKQYKHFVQKTEIWERIAMEMNETSEVMRTKWKGLKDGYIKYKKWSLHKHPSCKSYSNWCWGPHLEFLDPFVNPRKKKNLIKPANEHDNNLLHIQVTGGYSASDSHVEVTQANKNAFEVEEVLDDECHVKLEAEQSISGLSSPSTPRSESRTFLTDPIQTEETDNTKLISFMHSKCSKGVDAVDLLFMSYAETFRKFSVVTQTKLKVKMATIFADAELQEHELGHSVLS